MSKIEKRYREQFWILIKERLIDLEIGCYKENDCNHFMFIRPSEQMYDNFDNFNGKTFIFNFGINISYDELKLEVFIDDLEKLELLKGKLENKLNHYKLIYPRQNCKNCKINIYPDSDLEYIDINNAIDKMINLIIPSINSVFSAYSELIDENLITIPIRNNIVRVNKANSRKMSQVNGRKIDFPNELIDSAQMKALKERGVVFDENNLIELNEHNSEIIESLIVEGIPGISKKYVSRLTEYDEIDIEEYKYNKEAVYSWVRSIDKANGTMDHMRGFIACEFYTNWIINRENNFYEKLNGDENTIKLLVEEMFTAFINSVVHYNAASLASKICKYLHEKVYGLDKFYINDSVVRSMIPYYLQKYNLEQDLPEDYSLRLNYNILFDKLKAIHNVSCPNLSKTKFDHLLWFTYKSYYKVK